MLIALLALFVAMGGTTFAVSRIPRNSVGSKQLKRSAVRSRNIARDAVQTRHLRKRSVTRSKIAKNAVSSDLVGKDALTGGDILESSLGTVPLASSALSASTAGNADRIDGLHAAKIDYRSTAGTGAVEILRLGGLALTATCAAGPSIDVRATTTTGNAEIRAWGFGGPAGSGVTAADDDFEVGDSFDVDDVFSPAAEGGATLAYTTDAGAQVTATLQYDQSTPLGGTTACMVGGTALYAP
jgi:hypothetical protein